MSVVDVINEAKKHVGYVEGPNKDNIFGAWFGANHTAWCAEFVSYVMNHAGHGKLIAGAQTPKGFASCGKGIAFFKAKKAWFPVEQAKPGDIVFFDWNHDGEQDHVGIVTMNDVANKQLHTIEGNTSDASHSNGGIVLIRNRNYGVVMGVGRPAYPASKPKPAVVPASTDPTAPAPKAE